MPNKRPLQLLQMPDADREVDILDPTIMEKGAQATSHSTKKKDGTSASRAKNCAECRRLKMKCDRQIPCSNCQKRGTASLCPDGRLMSKEQRLVFANTEELHTKIEELTARIQELEGALAKLQAMHSDELHPLLDTTKNEQETLVTSFGSLRLHEDGTKRFYGATSSVEWIIGLNDDTIGTIGQIPEPPRNDGHGFSDSSASYPHPFKDISGLQVINTYFPAPIDEGSIDGLKVRSEVISGMPPKDTAITLINLYCDRGAWELNPVPRTQLIVDYLTAWYDCTDGPIPELQGLGLLYAVFANATLHDLTCVDSEGVAAHYMTLSRACLVLDSAISRTTLTAINTLLLHIAYYHASTIPHRAAKSEAVLGMTMQLALSIGLHRDPSMWNLPPDEAARRRRTMWELITSNLWLSLASGRPPLLSRRHFDVKLPLEVPDVTEPDPNFSRGKLHFTEACLWDLLDICLAPSSKSMYDAVLKMDTKIRSWELPQEMQVPRFEPSAEQKTLAMIRNVTGLVFREVVLMCLHRAYFARALLEPPFDPLRSIYSRSVLAAYASACAIIGGVRGLYERDPVALRRYAFFWTNTFSAAVILCAIAIRAPDCPLANTALSEFDVALEMYKREHVDSRESGLSALLRLRDQAKESLDACKEGRWNRPTTTDSELLLGLGASGAVVHTVKSPSGTLVQPKRGDVMASLEDLPPSLNEYLRSLDSNSQDISAMSGQIATSDSFLYGVLGLYGNQEYQPAPQPSSMPLGSFDNFSAPTMPRAHSEDPSNLYIPPNFHSSETSSVTPSDLHIASMSFPPIDSDLSLSSMQNDNSAFHWEEFLQELGVPRPNK